MVLRNQVEWALHCCSVLMSLPDEERLSARTLADFHGVPKEYLSKALQSLAQAGLIEGTLGPAGGYRLAKAPAQISFLDIVEAIEGPGPSFQCVEIRGNNPCLNKSERKFSSVCDVAKVMYRAEQAWRRELRAVTLADLGASLKTKLGPEQMRKNLEWLSSR